MIYVIMPKLGGPARGFIKCDKETITRILRYGHSQKFMDLGYWMTVPPEMDGIIFDPLQGQKAIQILQDIKNALNLDCGVF